MVDMCREKKTRMAEECCRSDRKRALRACTECDILLGDNGILLKAVRCDYPSIFILFLFSTSFSVELERTDRRDSLECKKRNAAETTDVLFR